MNLTEELALKIYELNPLFDRIEVIDNNLLVYNESRYVYPDMVREIKIKVKDVEIPAKLELSYYKERIELENDTSFVKAHSIEFKDHYITKIVIPLDVLKKYFGESIVEDLRKINIKDLLARTEKEEREKYILRGREATILQWGEGYKKVEIPLYHGYVSDFDDMIWLLALIESKYKLTNYDRYGSIKVKRYEKSNEKEKVEVLIDYYGNYIAIIRDPYSSLFELIPSIFKGFDEIYKEKQKVGFTEKGYEYKNIWYHDYEEPWLVDVTIEDWIGKRKIRTFVDYYRDKIIVPYRSISEVLLLSIKDYNYRLIYPSDLKEFFS
mgnify:CR=1 FL=1